MKLSIHTIPIEKASINTIVKYKDGVMGIVTELMPNNHFKVNIAHEGISVDNSTTVQPQHLHLTSDEEIKEGDWYLHTNGYADKKMWNVAKAEVGRLEILNNQRKMTGVGKLYFISRKIIATTDPRVQNCTCGGRTNEDNIFYHKMGCRNYYPHPTISAEDLNKITDLLNDGIDEVECVGLKVRECVSCKMDEDVSRLGYTHTECTLCGGEFNNKAIHKPTLIIDGFIKLIFEPTKLEKFQEGYKKHNNLFTKEQVITLGDKLLSKLEIDKCDVEEWFEEWINEIDKE